jgi:hypothetical protein
MKKLLIASAALAMLCAPALAHSTRHHHNTKTMTNRAHQNSMGMGTTGTGHGMQRRSMRPDASGQGGSGPGSDQGGTRVSPSDERHGY